MKPEKVKVKMLAIWKREIFEEYLMNIWVNLKTLNREMKPEKVKVKMLAIGDRGRMGGMFGF